MPEEPAGGTSRAEEYEACCAVEHQLGVLFRRAHALSAQLGRKVHPELDPGAYGLLVRIEKGAAVRPSDLAAYLGVGKATISRQVKVLEELGLVGRAPDPLDRRAHLLVLTDEGRRRLDHARVARQKQLHALLAAWPPEEVWLLARMLERLNALMEPLSAAASSTATPSRAAPPDASSTSASS